MMSNQIVGKITMGTDERRDMSAAIALSGLLTGNRSVRDNSIDAIAELTFQIADVRLASSSPGASRKPQP